MLRDIVATALLLFWVLAGTSAAADAVSAREFAVEPLTRYSLSFDAAVESGTGAAWELRVFNDEGLLPFEGVFSAEWQHIVPQRRHYTHDFLTPRDGVLLKLVLTYDQDAPRLSAVALAPTTNRNPVINGGFAAGPHNYSGWNTRHLAELEADGEGGLVLRCEPQGYALTDPVPVMPGATYRYTEGSTRGRVLVYDRDLLRTDWIDDFHYRNNPVLKMPPDAAFIRIEYCDGRSGRAPVIEKVGIELVERGPQVEQKTVPPYPGEIVVAPYASLPEVRAAREIQHWVRRISGKEMRVLAVESDWDHTRIFVGRTWAEQLFAADLKALEGSDGFAVRHRGRDIYVFGARPAGALFGAARFLETNTDLIWARPRKEFGAVYSEDPDLVFEKADLFARPAFAYRMSGTPYAARSDDGIWQGRAGLNTSSYFYNQFRRREMGGVPSFEGNFMGTIAQSPKYAFEKCREEHPEFFAIVNGKRVIAQYGYICYTAPGIAKAIAEGLCEVMRRAAERGDDLEHVHVRMRDGWTVCSCDACMQPIELPDGTQLEPKAETAQQDPLFFSTRMVLMLNRVAEEFAKTYPDVRIGVPAYIYSAEPPAIEHVPALMPSFCAYDTCSLRFPTLDGKNNHSTGGRIWEERFRTFLDRNRHGGRKLSYFSYHYTSGFSAVADSAAADWRAMVESGDVHAVHLDNFTPDTETYNRRAQYQHMWDHLAAERWVIARLMWDPALDPQELREYYIARTYREAAGEMRKFYNAIRDAWRDPGLVSGVNCHTDRASLFEAFIVRTGNEHKLRELLVAAEKEAVHPTSRELVRRTLVAFDRFAETLSRIYIPFVRESTAEWNLPDSTFWMQALKLGEFKRVSTWDDFEMAPAAHQTQVSVMRDEGNLYFRLEALDAVEKDRVEVILEAFRFSPQYYFAVDRAGTRYSMRDGDAWECPDWQSEVAAREGGYVAMFNVPLSAVREMDATGEETKLYGKFSRLVSGDPGSREESSLTGFALTMRHYMNYWTALSIRHGEGGR